VPAGELAAAGGDQAAFAEYDRMMRPFIAVNHALGIQSAQAMTQDPATTPVELSDSEIETVIDRPTHRVADARQCHHVEGLLGVDRWADDVTSGNAVG
jgi:hypothetical protein